MKYYYMFSCIQNNGSVYTVKMKGFNYRQAVQRMNEAKAVFTNCKDWKIIKVEQKRFN